MNAWLDPADFDMHLPEPALSLRSQLSLMLVDGDRRLTLEDVVALKHDMRMLLADRVKEDGRLVADRGDGWVLVVEFSDPPRAYSILAYGQSAREDSPHFSDQAGMFARNEMKRVAFTEEEIRAHTIRRYRPQLRRRSPD